MSYTYSEIKTQYGAIEKTLDRVLEQKSQILEIMEQSKAKRLLFIGCGSSYEISVSAQYTANLGGLPAFALAAGDLMLHSEDYKKVIGDSLVVVVTRSGETHEILNAVKILRESYGRKVLSVIARENSALQKMSDMSVLIPWAYDESVCQTRTVSNLYIASVLICAALTGNEQIFSGVRELAAQGDTYLGKIEPELQDAAKLDWNQTYVLGDGEICGILREGALAFTEIARISGKYYHVLDVRHGPMVLINEQSLVIVVLRKDGYDFYRELVKDLLNKKAKVITFTYEDCPNIEGVQLALSYYGNPGTATAGIPALNMIQLISYYKALETGFDPDHPEGLDAYIKLG